MDGESEIDKPQRLLTADQEKFLTHFENAMGIVSKACQAANISRDTFYAWYNGTSFKDFAEEFRRRIDDIRDVVDDIIEDAILQKVKSGDTMMIMYAANNRLRKRGYGRTDFNPVPGIPEVKQFILEIKADTLIIPPPKLSLPMNGNGHH